MSQPSAIATATSDRLLGAGPLQQAAIHRGDADGGHHEPDAALQRDALNASTLHEFHRQHVHRYAAGERKQRGKAHFQIKLAFRPGTGGIYEAARIEQAGGEGQETHHHEISNLPHLMSLKRSPFPGAAEA